MPRFFISLLPPQPVQDYAHSVIRELGDRYQTRTAHAPPHITLQPPFEWSLDAVTTLTDRLRLFASQRRAVPLTLEGFNAFAPRVLYVNVLQTAELMTLQRELMAELETMPGIVDGSSQRRPFSPHLTVASRNVTPTVFRQAWTELRDRPIRFEFVCDRLTLLIHDGRQWQVHSDFTLQNKKSEICPPPLDKKG